MKALFVLSNRGVRAARPGGRAASFLAACWSGDRGEEWAGTGFVLLCLCLPVGVAVGILGDELKRRGDGRSGW